MENLIIYYLDTLDKQNRNLTKNELLNELRPILIYSNNSLFNKYEFGLSQITNIYELFLKSINSLIAHNIIFIKEDIIYLNKNNQILNDYYGFEKNSEIIFDDLINSLSKITLKYDINIPKELNNKQEKESNNEQEKESNNKQEKESNSEHEINNGLLDVYEINSFSKDRLIYHISTNLDYCTCPAFFHRNECKHLDHYKANKNELNNLKRYEIEIENNSNNTDKETDKETDEELDQNSEEDNIVNTYIIDSFVDNKKKYNLSFDLKFCSCPSFMNSENKKCKHIKWYEDHKEDLNKFKTEEVILKLIE